MNDKLRHERARATQRVKLAAQALSIAINEASDLGLTTRLETIQITAQPKKIAIKSDVVHVIMSASLPS